MYSGNNGQRCGLMRPVSADSGPAQSAELYDMTNQIELERSRHIKLKSENIEYKCFIGVLQLEKCKSWEASLKNDTCFIALNSMKAELAVAKLRITTLRANSTLLESVLEMPKKPAKRKNALESIPVESNLIISSLSIIQDDDEPDSRENTLIKDGEIINKTEHNPFPNAFVFYQQEAVLSESVAFRILKHVGVKSTNNYHAITIVSVPLRKSLQAENETNPKTSNIPVCFQNPFPQKKDQMKKSVWDSNDIGKRQGVGNKYNN
ncbi:unnamed protein product [Brugia pahangi]|uniref:Alba domain-containing protein n=1 Tax=Brugia pahangi TaxID=6280 RepID=A0A158PS31_BRUPA|nr:unnamed protein product [Brugia pahangi]